MAANVLVKLFEHNNWANNQILQACADLSDEQLDAEPRSATKGSIRRTLIHLVASQGGYHSLLTVPVEERVREIPSYDQLEESLARSGEGLLALARDQSGESMKSQRRSTDGYTMEPWVVMVQAINHATEHREQIKSMLSALGVTPPGVSGWDYGEATNALVQIAR
jgi:uncharacterized damage-inducible protein DinB